MTPATEALVERLEAGDYRMDDAHWIVDENKLDALASETAAALRVLSDSLEGTDEDLYQAVLVAYRRGAHEWARLNYPKWIDRIARDAADHIGATTQMISPPPAGEE